MSKIHFIGDCGASMSVLKKIAKEAGHDVSGSDLLTGGHDPKNIDHVDKVIYTCALEHDNVELKRAYELNKEVIERAQFLAEISKEYEHMIAVAGAHGKTTTTALIAKILEKYNPTVHIGGNIGNNSLHKIGNKELFITEACEYRRNFLYLKPEIGVITNIELDHVDYFLDEKDYSKAFMEYAERCKVVIASKNVFQKIKRRKNTLVVDIIKKGEKVDKEVACCIVKQSKSSFTVFEYGVKFGNFKHKLHGNYNIENAAIAIATARYYGANFEDIKTALINFVPVDRRFQIIKRSKYCTIISDYAHHPTQIKATLLYAKECYKNVIAVFQPHTYSRLRAMMKEFAESLSLADMIYVLPVFPAREKAIVGVDNHALIKVCLDKGKRAFALNNIDELEEPKIKNSVIIYLSAGIL